MFRISRAHVSRRRPAKDARCFLMILRLVSSAALSVHRNPVPERSGLGAGCGMEPCSGPPAGVTHDGRHSFPPQGRFQAAAHQQQ
jgi:hypothetical protein